MTPVLFAPEHKRWENHEASDYKKDQDQQKKKSLFSWKTSFLSNP